jgi:hypothetical protein
MNRMLFALAIASMSLAAAAGQPGDKPPVGPVQVDVVSTVSPRPYYDAIAFNKEGTSSAEECLAVNDTNVKITGLSIRAAGGTEMPTLDINVTVKKSPDLRYSILDKRVLDTDFLYALPPASYYFFVQTIPMVFRVDPDDQICLRVMSSITTADKSVSVSMVVFGEAL